MSTASTRRWPSAAGSRPSLAKIDPTWVSTVLGDRNSRSQMALFERPSAIRARMSRLPPWCHLARAGTRDRVANAIRAVLATMAPTMTQVRDASANAAPVISTASSVAMPMHPAIPARAASR
jgi:hypothetical protein